MRGLEERLRFALEDTETGFWEWDVASDTIEWSENVGPLYGLPRGTQPLGFEDYLGRMVAAADQEELRALVRAAVEDGTPYSHDVLIRLTDGGERWLNSRVRVIDEPGGRRLIGVLTDVTERRRREDGRVFLDEASQALAASLDLVATLEEVARLAVPRLADWCAVQLAAEVRGAYEQVAVAHVDPEKVRWAQALQDKYPPDPDAPTGAPEVIRTGRSELYPVIDAALLEAAALDEEQREIVAELQMHSVMVVPLAARGRTLGAITFVYAESARTYSTRELALAEELGRRAGIALDHARLFMREHRTAETLQRALLPAALPVVGGYELAVRYAPSDARDHAGGDWYDAFRLPDGRYGIVVGDVGGRGMQAAATMGQIRNALRAYALKDGAPAAVIDDLHALVAMSDGAITFVTVVYVVIDPATGAGELASAGHPPPLFARRGLLDAPIGPPLGLSGAPPCTRSTFTLEPGDTLWLYTDGLVESRTRPIDVGLSALAAAAGSATGDLEAIADELIASVPGARGDDIALLGLRRQAS